MKNLATLSILIFALITNLYAHGIDEQEKQYKGPASKTAYIVSPKDGETVSQKFKIVFGLKGMSVSPAGIEKANSGHHHLLVDAKELPDLTSPLGNSVKHFGGGQTETSLTLTPGSHTLQLILADYKHLPHTPAVISKKITITVE